MEKEIRDNDYVLIVCTPNYRMKSNERKGGVGYEGDIMTSEVLTTKNHRKFVPILSRGSWKESAPSWLQGKAYVDLSTERQFEMNYQDLLATFHGTKPSAPPLRQRNQSVSSRKKSKPNDPIKIIGIIIDEITQPKRDGTPGSALYSVPFRLNQTPTRLWSDIFVDAWDRPPQYSSMHRPRIARVSGDRIILDGTTIEEVKKYHRTTLLLCVNVANEKEREYLIQRRDEEIRRQQQMEAHRKQVENEAKNISFD